MGSGLITQTLAFLAPKLQLIEMIFAFLISCLHQDNDATRNHLQLLELVNTPHSSALPLPNSDCRLGDFHLRLHACLHTLIAFGWGLTCTFFKFRISERFFICTGFISIGAYSIRLFLNLRILQSVMDKESFTVHRSKDLLHGRSALARDQSREADQISINLFFVVPVREALAEYATVVAVISFVVTQVSYHKLNELDA